jgi:hypothetical protein
MEKRQARRGLALGFASLMMSLAGCSTPTPFQPADSTGNNGYTVTQVEVNRFRIAFTGNDVTPRQTVDIDLLYLAAQVTLKNHADWFELGKLSTDKTTAFPTYPGGFGPFGGPVAFGGWGGGYPGAWGGGLETDFNSPQNIWLEAADIVIHHGKKPDKDSAAYDAHDVAAHLAPAVGPRDRSRFS